MKLASDASAVIKFRAWLRQGESATLEFKRSTGEVKEGLQTLCAFLNGSGGTVLFGIQPYGTIEGQLVSGKPRSRLQRYRTTAAGMKILSVEAKL